MQKYSVELKKCSRNDKKYHVRPHFMCYELSVLRLTTLQHLV